MIKMPIQSENIEQLKIKYAKILELYDSKNSDHDILADLIEKSKIFIDTNYSKLNINHKIAAVFVIINLYLNWDKFDKSKIETYIKEFFEYVNRDYDKYISSLIITKDRFDADITFYNFFIVNKIEK